MGKAATGAKTRENVQGDYAPVRWTAKKRALAIVSGVAVALLSLGCAAALYAHTIDLALTAGMDDDERRELVGVLTRPKPELEAPTRVVVEEPHRSLWCRRPMPIMWSYSGCDARPHETIARSDVTMLARIDPDTGTVHSSPFPSRYHGGDRRVRRSEDKRRACLRPAGAVKAISEFAGAGITHYLDTRFEQLVELVDRLGGVTVNVPEGFTADTSGITLAAGEQRLTGEEALAFARERHAVSSGDFSRAAQRAIISAIADKVLASPPTEMPSLVGSLAAYVTTDYTVAELADTALALKDAGVTVYSAACPSYSFGEGGISYVGVMYDEWRAMMQRVDAGLDPADESAEIPEPQVSDEDLGAAANARSPRDYSGRVDQAGFKDN